MLKVTNVAHKSTAGTITAVTRLAVTRATTSSAADETAAERPDEEQERWLGSRSCVDGPPPAAHRRMLGCTENDGARHFVLEILGTTTVPH